MKYTLAHFKHCAFNPLSPEPLIGPMSEIVPVDTVEPNLDALLRHTIMLYDPKSPLIADERDMNQRKGLAADLAGLPEDEETRDQIFNFTNSTALDLACRYLVRYGRSKEWAAICAFEFRYWEAVKLMFRPITSEKDKEQLDASMKKDVLAESIIAGIDTLDKLYRKFFNEDADLESRAKSRLSPELMAGAKK